MVNCPETNYWDMMDNETKLNNKQKLQWYWNFWFVALLKTSIDTAHTVYVQFIVRWLWRFLDFYSLRTLYKYFNNNVNALNLPELKLHIWDQPSLFNSLYFSASGKPSELQALSVFGCMVAAVAIFCFWPLFQVLGQRNNCYAIYVSILLLMSGKKLKIKMVFKI